MIENLETTSNIRTKKENSRTQVRNWVQIKTTLGNLHHEGGAVTEARHVG